MRNKVIELIAGIFMIIGFLALLFLAFKVSGLTFAEKNTYEISADFDDIGSLKKRAPVEVSGVTIGRVSNIYIDPDTFRARVIMQVYDSFKTIPIDSSASIYTQGILGSNYIALAPGFDSDMIKPGGRIETTHSALILENLIGQLLFSLKPSEKTEEKATEPAKESAK